MSYFVPAPTISPLVIIAPAVKNVPLVFLFATREDFVVTVP
jgi:hypothetical protein